MCNHIYAPSHTRAPGTIGKQCPYSGFYKAFALPGPPTDSSGACIFHSKAIEWKRDNNFEGHFLTLVHLLNADKTLKSYDFAEFIFVGGNSELAGSSEHVIHIADTTFQRQAYFSQATFLDPLVIENVDFIAGADFGEARFEHNIKVTNVRFCGLDFTKAIFAQGVLFITVKSTSYALFDKAQFVGSSFGYLGYVVAFKESLFEGITSFSDAIFKVGAESSIVFLETRFEDSLDFGRTHFQCQVIFTDVSFAGTTDFTDTLFDKVSTAARYRGSAVEFNRIAI